MYHPLLPVSNDKDDPAVYGDFAMLERSPAAKQVRDSMIRLHALQWHLRMYCLQNSAKCMYNSILLTGLEFDCTMMDFLCPGHWLFIDRFQNFQVIRFCILHRNEQNTTVITTDYASPRGTSQSEGVDHNKLRLRYQWGPVSVNKVPYVYKIQRTPRQHISICIIDWFNMSINTSHF